MLLFVLVFTCPKLNVLFVFCFYFKIIIIIVVVVAAAAMVVVVVTSFPVAIPKSQ